MLKKLIFFEKLGLWCNGQHNRLRQETYKVTLISDLEIPVNRGSNPRGLIFS